MALSTAVPLTPTGLEPKLHGIEHQAIPRIGENLSKARGRSLCIDTKQAHCLGCLTLV